MNESIVINLRNAIAKGEFKPGERIKQEALSRRFSVSRMPIREALKQLEREGFVKTIPNVGARVVEFSEKDLSDIYDMLIILESSAARLACSKMSDDQIGKLRDYQLRMERAGGERNFPFFFQLNVQFHWLITECTENPYLIETRKNFMNLVNIFIQFAAVLPDGIMTPLVKTNFEEHPMIVDALEKRNPALAEFAMKEHMDKAKKLHLLSLSEGQIRNDVDMDTNKS
jgi:DNA-binding GntR family transcriptional regulator